MYEKNREIKLTQLFRVLLLSALAMLFIFWKYMYYFLSANSLKIRRKDFLPLREPELHLTNCLQSNIPYRR